ncbi:MAG: VirK/YbjX family protein [Proteobacteria bacterium]|nr:VirK/YbjX family protein [Pseudomonadota bacterium]
MRALMQVLRSNLAFDKKLKLFFWWLFSRDCRHYLSEIQAKFIAANLARLLVVHPFLFYMFRAHAFLLKGQSQSSDILAKLLAHYQSLASRQSLAIIESYFAQGQSLWQGNFDGLAVSLLLQYDHRMRFEGQLSLKLLLNDEEAYFVNFVLDADCAYVAGIQGVKDNKGLYKNFTKQLHGLRPQNFIWMAFLDWCRTVGIKQVYGVRPEWHVYQNETKSQHKIGFDYETFWQEVGGICFDAIWYQLPIDYPHKPIEEVEQKKRSVYRKRYALLDEVGSMIEASVKAV